MADIGAFTPEQARLLWQDFLSRQQLNPLASKNLPQRRPLAERVGRHLTGTLDEDLAAATAFADGPATAELSVWLKDDDGDMYDSGENITVTNRDESTSYAEESVVKVEWIDGEWQPYSGGTLVVLVGFVTKCLGRGWHEVRVEDWEPDVVEDPWGDCNCCDSGIACGSGDSTGSIPIGECGEDETCGEDLEQLYKYMCDQLDGCGAVDMDRGAELAGSIVRVHSCGQLPMRVGGMVRFTKWKETASYIHRANSGSGFVDPWRGKYYVEVGHGERPLRRVNEETWANCVDELTGVCTTILTGTVSYLVEYAGCCPTAGDTCETVEPSGAPE